MAGTLTIGLTFGFCLGWRDRWFLWEAMWPFCFGELEQPHLYNVLPRQLVTVFPEPGPAESNGAQGGVVLDERQNEAEGDLGRRHHRFAGSSTRRSPRACHRHAHASPLHLLGKLTLGLSNRVRLSQGRLSNHVSNMVVSLRRYTYDLVRWI